jgi:hypothetical protein
MPRCVQMATSKEKNLGRVGERIGKQRAAPSLCMSKS